MTQLVRVETFPLDPNVFAGAGRIVSGILRTGTVTTNIDFDEYARWLYVGVTGNISYVKWDGSSQTLSNVTGGVWHPICAVRVNSAGTTASGLVWGN